MERKNIPLIVAGVMLVTGLCVLTGVVGKATEPPVPTNPPVKSVVMDSFSLRLADNETQIDICCICDSFFKFVIEPSYTAAVDGTCWQYSDGSERLELNTTLNYTYPDSTRASYMRSMPLGKGVYLLKDGFSGGRFGFDLRPFTRIELESVTRYFRRFYPLQSALNSTFVIPYRDIQITNTPTNPSDYFYFTNGSNIDDMPLFILMRNATSANGKFVELPLTSRTTPSLIVDVTFARYNGTESFMVHTPGYYEVLDKSQNYPPNVYKWSKKTFDEQRGKMQEKGETALAEFDSIVERLRTVGVNPPEK